MMGMGIRYQYCSTIINDNGTLEINQNQGLKTANGIVIRADDSNDGGVQVGGAVDIWGGSCGVDVLNDVGGHISVGGTAEVADGKTGDISITAGHVASGGPDLITQNRAGAVTITGGGVIVDVTDNGGYGAEGTIQLKGAVTLTPMVQPTSPVEG
jgi:hypothetical protein